MMSKHNLRIDQIRHTIFYNINLAASIEFQFQWLEMYQMFHHLESQFSPSAPTILDLDTQL